MRTTRVWRRVLGVEHTVIESVGLEPGGRGGEVLVARVRPRGGQGSRCSRCRRRCPRYDVSASPRRWRGLDLGTTRVSLQATTRRVSCPTHGVVVAAVPWARPGARFTTAFEYTAAWLVCHATLSVVAVGLRIAWRSVAGIVTRVVTERAGATDRLAGLRRIGIDEISYKKGQRYLLVVTCHDTGRLVWAGKERTKQNLAAARPLLIGWLAWATRCRLPAFVQLAKTIKKFQQLILNAVEHGLSNARSEATNTHLRLLTRRSYGLSPETLMAMADLTRGGLYPPLPGRAAA